MYRDLATSYDQIWPSKQLDIMLRISGYFEAENFLSILSLFNKLFEVSSEVSHPQSACCND